ncbi:MAG: hypothetical protein KGL53_10935, partial [Elusimicrobia bacterium]|nr:hypothetical protein [Elusimicrobiota bacterium]
LGRARSRARRRTAPEAALLGVGGAAVVCAEPEDPEAVARTLLSAKEVAEAGLAAAIQSRLEDVKSGMEFSRTHE